jgi:hypothetical protein
VERNHEEEVKGVVPLTIGVVGREGRDRNPGRFGLRTNGAGDRDRTGDIQLGKLAFYR